MPQKPLAFFAVWVYNEMNNRLDTRIVFRMVLQARDVSASIKEAEGFPRVWYAISAQWRPDESRERMLAGGIYRLKVSPSTKVAETNNIMGIRDWVERRKNRS